MNLMAGKNHASQEITPTLSTTPVKQHEPNWAQEIHAAVVGLKHLGTLQGKISPAHMKEPSSPLRRCPLSQGLQYG